MISHFVRELRDSFAQSERWLYMAWVDTKLRYRRTKLGPVWMVLFAFITTVCTGILASLLFKMNFRGYFPYVCFGMITWAYITSNITEASNVFIAQTSIIKNTNVSLLNFCLRMFVKNTIVFFHALVIAALVMAYFRMVPTWNLFLLVPALFLFMVTSASLGIILGFLSARFRDVHQLIQSTLGLLIFVTPIIWRADMLGERAYLVNYNPLTHYVALIRDPLLGLSPSTTNFMVSSLFSLFLLTTAFFLYNKYRKRLVHWL